MSVSEDVYSFVCFHFYQRVCLNLSLPHHSIRCPIQFTLYLLVVCLCLFQRMFTHLYVCCLLFSLCLPHHSIRCPIQRVHFLYMCSLPKSDINNMHPDWPLSDLLVANS